MTKYVGITERGDAGLDLSWKDKLKTDAFGGAVLITKRGDRPEFQNAITDVMIKNPDAYENKKLIIHFTITGWGGTAMEPNVSTPETVIASVKNLIKTFPANNIVIRVDPIIPTDEGLERAKHVFDLIASELPEIKRVRISIYDDYHKAREEMMRRGYPPVDNFTKWKNESERRPNQNQINKIAEIISAHKKQFRVEMCAEPELAEIDEYFLHTGCVSKFDCDILGISVPDDILTNMQNRFGCQCLSIKREMLTNKCVCANNCAYCYWR